MERKTVLKSLAFKFLERLGTQGITFIVGIILARLLSPDDYGAIAMLTVFITISQVFVQSGLNTALIQKKDANDVDFSSVFYISVTLAVILYIILYFSAPFVARFYKMDELCTFLRVLGLILLPNAFNSIQNAKVTKSMQFGKLLYSSLIAAVISGTVGIIMASLGFGTWALIAQQLTSSVVICVVMMVVVHWRPKWVFSIERAKGLFRFGVNLLISQLLNTIYINIKPLIIGRVYSSADLGQYNKGWQFPSLLSTNIDGAINSVMLPALSAEQDNKQRVKQMMRRSVTTSAFIMFPMMAGLAAVGTPLVSLLLTDKWLPCVPIMQMGCLVYVFQPICTANLQAINAMGHSDIFLKLEIVKKILGLIVIAVTVPYGIYVMAVGSVVMAIVGTIINVYPNKKLLDYGYIEQIKDILPYLLISVVMLFAVLALGRLSLPLIPLLAIQCISGAAIYVALSWFFKVSGFVYITDMIKKFLSERKK